MDIRNATTIMKRRLSQRGWWKLFGLNTAISLAAGLLVTILLELLKTPEATGLAGLDTRATLEGICGILESAVAIALPFWEIGTVYLCLQLVRKEETGMPSLLQGFRRFGPVLRLLLMKFLILMGATFALMYITLNVVASLPQTAEATALLQPMLESGQVVEMEPVLEILLDTMLPVLLVLMGLFLLVYLFITFRLRWAEYAIMSDDTYQATAAIRGSWRLTKGNCKKLLLLDLRFWWFYLLDAIVLAVGYLNLILPSAGISLPIDTSVSEWLFYGIYLVLRLVVYTFLYPRMKITYAAAYDILTQRTPEE